MEKYKTFVRSQSQAIASIESTLKSLSYILPGRFQNADIASESIYTLTHLFSALNANILASDKQKYFTSDSQPSAFNKYTRLVLFGNNRATTFLSFVLEFIRKTELLCEMVANKVKGQVGRWRCIVMIESIKFILRLYLFQSNQQRMLLHSSILEAELEPTVPNNNIKKAEQGEKLWTGKRTGITRPYSSVIESKGIEYLVSRSITETNSLDLVKPLSKWRRASEYLYLVRPLLYLLAIYKFGLKSWKPWMLSLGLECASVSLMDPSLTDPSIRLSLLESDEIKYRQRTLLYYLLKRPFYDFYTRNVINGFCDGISQVPLLSIIASLIRDYQPYWENYHFYTN